MNAETSEAISKLFAEHSSSSVDGPLSTTVNLEDVPIEHLDYNFVEKCEDYHELWKILSTLKSGKHGNYTDLENETERRMLDVMPSDIRSKYLAMTSVPGASDITAAAEAIADFVTAGKAADTAQVTASSGSTQMPTIPAPRGYTSTPTSSSSTGLSGTVSQSIKPDSKALPFHQYYQQWDQFDADRVCDQSIHSHGCMVLIHAPPPPYHHTHMPIFRLFKN